MLERYYIVDADVLMTAKNMYYGFDICPGFWKCLLHFHQEGKIFSIDKVYEEVLKGHESEDLVLWVKNDLPKEFFVETDDSEISGVYSNIMSHVKNSGRYIESARAKFARSADGWLAAHAEVHFATVITLELPEPASKKSVKLPDVCKEFDIPCMNTFEMLRELGVQFDWAANN